MRYNLALTKIEKDVLYRKYKSNGLDSWEASYKVEGISKHLKELVSKLMEQKKSDNVIYDRFRQEFEMICMRLET